MIHYLGVDPSQRGTGLVVLDSSLDILAQGEIKTADLPLLESGRKICADFTSFVLEHVHTPDARATTVITMEKMMPSAGTGPLLFYVQMLLLDCIEEWFGSPLFVNPLPVQLHSYIQRRSGIKIRNKTNRVQAFQKVANVKMRVSSNIADAYFLAKFGAEVFTGTHEYKLSDDTYKLSSWSVINCRPQ